MKLFFCFAIFMFSFTELTAQRSYLSSPEEARELSHSALDTLMKGKLSGFFNLLRPHWVLSGMNLMNQMEQFTLSYSAAAASHGEPIGVLKVGEEKIKDIAIKEIYWIRFEANIMVFNLVYYKSNKGWVLYDIYF